MKRTVFLSAFLFLAALVSFPAPSNAYLFDDNFNSFNTSVWETATLPYIVGPTDVYTATTEDSRSVLHLKSTYTIPGDVDAGKGFQTQATFTGLSSATAELSFKTGPAVDKYIGNEEWGFNNIDGLIALSLWNPTNSKYISIYLYGGDHGRNRVVEAYDSIHDSEVNSYNGPGFDTDWNYNTWYRLVIAAQATNTKVAFLTDGGVELWSHTFDDVGLNDLGNFKLAMTQFMGWPVEGTWDNEAYADRLTMTPVPPSALLLGSGLLGLLALRGWGRRRRG